MLLLVPISTALALIQASHRRRGVEDFLERDDGVAGVGFGGQHQQNRRGLNTRQPMSALPPKADIVRHVGNVRFVPEAAVRQVQQMARYSITLSAIC